eukprot:m.1155828 g.1155828  ORF g.1155828 m.1155828 type:complete len:50 (+) comp24491_c0_seq21:1835-1984(+)
MYIELPVVCDVPWHDLCMALCVGTGAGKAKSSNKASAVFDHPGTLSRKS